MTTANKFQDEILFSTLMDILTKTDIHQNANRRYYATSKSGDIIVMFLAKNNDELDVCVAATKPIIALSGSKLELSPESKQKLYQQLSTRIKNKPIKKITDNDFNRISALLKHLYVGSDVTQLKSMLVCFEHNLREVFNDIVGSERCISENDIVNLQVYLQQKYSEWIKSNSQTCKQRKK